MRCSLIAVALAVLPVLAHPAHALQVPLKQDRIESPEGTVTGYLFGRSLAVADFDGDGFDDLVAMEPGATAGGDLWAGRGWVLKGPAFNPVVKFEARGPEKEEYLGSGGCWTGDVNADGAVDILVGSYEYKVGSQLDVGRAHVFLGPDYTVDIVLQEPEPKGGAWFGFSGVLADFDGDSRDDVLVSANRADVRQPAGVIVEGAGKIWLWNALSLFDPMSLKKPVLIGDPQPLKDGAFGSVLAVEELSGQPPLDLLVTRNASTCCPFTEGDVYVFDGLGPGILDKAGQSSLDGVDAVGSDIDLADVTGDGVLDLVLGAPLSDLLACQDAGRVVVLEGPDFDRLAFSLESPFACTGSYWLFGAKGLVLDLDRDGDQDIVCKDPVSTLSSFDLVEVFWGPAYDSFESLGDEGAPAHFIGLGVSMVSGDFDGDGFDELAFGAIHGNASGCVYIYDPQTLTADASEVPVSTGGDVTFTLRMAPEDHGKAFVAGLGVSSSKPGIVLGPGSFVPLNPDAVTFAGLALLTSPLLEGFLGRLDQSASASFTLHLPPGFPAPLIGQTLTVAAVVIEPDGRLGAGSSAAEVLLAP